MLNKILFPTDFSDNSERVKEYAIDTAKKFKAEVLILHVFDVPTLPYSNTALDSYLKEEEKIKRECLQLLSKVEADFKKEDIATTSKLEKGRAPHVIMSNLTTDNYNMLIMGSRGWGNLKSFFLGSVSNYVIHHSKVPVLVIH